MANAAVAQGAEQAPRKRQAGGSTPPRRATFFVPGALINPLNGSFSRAHWSKKSAWANEWRERTRACWLMADVRPFDDLRLKRRITFKAIVARPWDDDNLPAAIKPIRDALVGSFIHTDAPGCHEFVYRQVTGKQRGVWVTVETV